MNITGTENAELGAGQEGGPSIRELTLAVEFLTTAIRAIADGHPINGSMVRDPILWGFSKARDIASVYKKQEE